MTPADLTEDRIARYISATFEPQPDITAYELAQVFAYHWGNGITEEQWETLGPITRHFRRTA